MQSTLYVALSAQVALQNRLDTIAQNVANGATAGYRASEIKFESVIADAAGSQVAFVSPGTNVIKRSPGEIVKTGNPLDVAVRGEGWLSISTPSGQAYTRDGRMQLTASGDLVSLSGASILDAGGAPIQLDPSAGQPVIGADGIVTQAGRRTGALGLFSLPGDAQLTRVEGGVTSSLPAAPVLDSARNGIMQGFVEQSNVNPVSEVARLVYVQRAFEGISSTMQASETSFKNAIQTLGSSS